MDVLENRYLIAVLAILTVIFAALSIVFVPEDPSRLVNRKIAVYTQGGVLYHTAFLKNNSLYGMTLSDENYPTSLVDKIAVNYVYRTSEEVEGKYHFYGKAIYTISRGNKEIIMWEDELFNETGDLDKGRFSTLASLNFASLNQRFEEISNELGMNRLDRKIRIYVNVTEKGVFGEKETVDEFSHLIEVIKDPAGVYYFRNSDKILKKSVTTEEIVEKYVSFFGFSLNVSTAKMIFPPLLIASSIPLTAGVYLRRRKTFDDLKELREFIVEGNRMNIERRIRLNSVEDLKKTFELLDKPIIHFTSNGKETYVIVDKDIAYEFNRDL